MSNTQTITTNLAAVAGSLTVMPEWLSKIITANNLTGDSRVEATWMFTPFGNYLITVTPEETA